MKDQNKKMLRWILGGVILIVFLIVPEMFIANLISNNNPECWRLILAIMLGITAFIYLIISGIKIVKYQKFAENYEKEKLEKISKELTKEFKPVLLNYSEAISKDLFECQAKVDDEGKIIYKIHLDYDGKFENYEEFLRFFHIQE